MPQVNTKLDIVQALRALAALLVVYTHSIISSDIIFGGSLQGHYFFLKDWGSIGVDIFFIISGFIMTRIIWAYSFANLWKTFLLKRGVRILPLYWLLSCLGIIAQIIQNLDLSYIEIGKSLLFFPILDSREFTFPVMNVGWTLCFEVYFYTIISFFLFFRQSKILYTLTTFILCISILGIFANPNQSLLRFLTSPLLIEFCLGLISGIIYNRININGRSIYVFVFTITLVGIVAIVSTIYMNINTFSPVFILNNNYLAINRVVYWGLPSSLFILGIVLYEKLGLLKTHPFLILIGDASYSNYLLHMFIINFFTKIGSKISNYFLFINPDLYIITLTIFCTMISVPFYLCIEKPITRFTTKYIFKSRNALSVI